MSHFEIVVEGQLEIFHLPSFWTLVRRGFFREHQFYALFYAPLCPEENRF